MNDLVAIQNNLSSLLQTKMDALPRNFNQTRFIQNCLSVLKSINGIENIDIKSIQDTIMKGAFLGLDFANKECYAIPYGKKLPNGQWIKELQFQTDYKGEKKIVRKYAIKQIKDLYAHIVREGDILDVFIESGNQVINFKPVVFSDKEIIGVFAVCLYENGEMIIETMSVKEVIEIKNNFSKKDKDGSFSKAWENSFGEMCKKTVLRRLCKHIEIDFESIEQKQVYEGVSDFEMPKMVDISEPLAETKQVIENTTEKVEAKISDAQLKRLLTIQSENKVTDDMLKPCLANYGYKSRKLILKKDYDAIITDIEAMGEMLRIR